jgi:anaerobic ribonucleoside-triphosphate reductase
MPRLNATCSDCYHDYEKVDDDPGTCCDRCADTRGAWAETHAGRLGQAREAWTMAKASLRLKRRTEVA